MKIADYISKSIQEYPSLYKDVDYEKSKLKVLNHIFFTIGNGLEMAETDNPAEGGYFVEPKYKEDKKTGDWIRIKDKPYGKEKYKPIPDGYFESIVYYVSASERPIETIYRKGQYRDDRVFFRYDKEVDREFRKPELYKAESLHPFSPYPLSKGFSIASYTSCDGFFLQTDWMEELIIICKSTLEYFNNENQYKNNHFYPSKDSIKRILYDFKKRFKEGGLERVIDVRKTWGYEAKETLPDYAEIETNAKSNWVAFRAEQIEILTSCLKMN
jgi:hypothetical protein